MGIAIPRSWAPISVASLALCVAVLVGGGLDVVSARLLGAVALLESAHLLSLLRTFEIGEEHADGGDADQSTSKELRLDLLSTALQIGGIESWFTHTDGSGGAVSVGELHVGDVQDWLADQIFGSPLANVVADSALHLELLSGLHEGEGLPIYPLQLGLTLLSVQVEMQCLIKFPPGRNDSLTRTRRRQSNIMDLRSYRPLVVLAALKIINFLCDRPISSQATTSSPALDSLSAHAPLDLAPDLDRSFSLTPRNFKFAAELGPTSYDHRSPLLIDEMHGSVALEASWSATPSSFSFAVVPSPPPPSTSSSLKSRSYRISSVCEPSPSPALAWTKGPPPSDSTPTPTTMRPRRSSLHAKQDLFLMSSIPTLPAPHASPLDRSFSATPQWTFASPFSAGHTDLDAAAPTYRTVISPSSVQDDHSPLSAFVRSFGPGDDGSYFSSYEDDDDAISGSEADLFSAYSMGGAVDGTERGGVVNSSDGMSRSLTEAIERAMRNDRGVRYSVSVVSEGRNSVPA